MDSTHLKGKKVIGIDGYWYDITKFIPHHPGGDVIMQYVGKDATSVFHAFHEKKVLQHRRPCTKMESSQNMDTVDAAFDALRKEFEDEGFFQTNYYWYLFKFVHSAVLLACCVILMTTFSSPLAHLASSGFLAAFWQQSGFFMHDFMHNHLTGDRKIDQYVGTFFGTICFGVSASWWRDEHFVHHALTNCINYSTGFIDPQAVQDTWAQNIKLLPFFRNKISHFLIRIQHITFLPLCMCAGRYAIIIKAMTNESRRHEILAFILHCLWTYKLFSYLDSYQEIIVIYMLAAFLEGILHIQLLISHYSKPFYMTDEISKSKHWYRMQVECNIDITSPVWLDWFHGGLNYHLVHHLFPRMPRHNYRRATERVKKVCEEQGIKYDSCTWTEAVKRTLNALKDTSIHFSLDPR